MTISQRTTMLYERVGGERYPSLTLRIEGVHDVGRIIATLARGNVEHAAVAREVGRELNRTPEGRATLAYLERHGGPALGPEPCEECVDGRHGECTHDPVEGWICSCYEADEDAMRTIPQGVHAA